MSNRAEIERKTEEILTPAAQELGCRVYDVDYSKEGPDYYLCCYIDKDTGVTIDDCEAVSRKMSDLLDEADFIPDAYTLIVSSPGLGRTLTKDRHFAASIGQEVEGTTFAPVVMDPEAAQAVIETAPDGSMTKTAQKKARAKKKAQEGTREFRGVLTAFDKDSITIAVQNKKGDSRDIRIERKNIARVRLTVDF